MGILKSVFFVWRARALPRKRVSIGDFDFKDGFKVFFNMPFYINIFDIWRVFSKMLNF